MKLNLKNPIVFFDLETTGVNINTDRIVEICYLKVHPNGNEESKTLRINPEMHIPEESSAIHGIYDADVADCPTFRMVANDTLQARAIGSFAATQLSASRYAALDDGTPYGKGLTDGAAAQLKAENKEVVVRKSFDDKTVEFDALAGELKAARVEVIVSTLNDFQALALLKALQKVGHTQVKLLGGDSVKTTDMAKGAGLIEGLYATSPVLEAKEFTTGKPFLEKYIDAYQKPPAYGGHYSYDSTYVLTAAMQKAKSAEPKDIIKAMRTINGYAPVIGTMSWDDKGEQRYGAVGVYELRGGAWELRMRSDRW